MSIKEGPLLDGRQELAVLAGVLEEPRALVGSAVLLDECPRRHTVEVVPRRRGRWPGRA